MLDISLADGLGTLAATISALSLVPQVVKTWRTRSADDLSMGWLLTALCGATLWMSYGIFAPAWAVVAGNAVPLALVALLVALKLWRRRPPVARTSADAKADGVTDGLTPA